MALVHSVIAISALIGIGKTKIANDTWPGCGGKIPRHDQRDWSAWYKWYKNNSTPPDIKVHVYRHPPFNWLHPNCTSMDHPHFEMYPRWKHSDDYHFAAQAQSILNTDPKNATIFLVPAFLNMYTAATFIGRGKNNDWHAPWRNFCCDVRGTKLCHSDLVEALGKQLAKSPWFKRRGGFDHLLVVSHWSYKVINEVFTKYPALAASSQINFENNRLGQRPRSSISLPNLYVGKHCPNAPATPRSTPPKHMGFHFIGDIRKPDKDCGAGSKIALRQRCQAMFLAGGADLRLKMCSAVALLPKAVKRRSYCASSAYVHRIYRKYCGKHLTVGCSLKVNKTKRYCDSRRQGGSQFENSTKCEPEDPTYCDSITNATFVLHIKGDTLGSNRLWDAIENGAIPVMTDPRQYNIVPFESLWRSMTVDLNVNASAPASAIAKSLEAKSEEVRGRWSTLMAALEKGRRIVSWRDPHSVTLRAYVQLLVDRLRTQPCGPCVRNENVKAKCRQPRCTTHNCTWVQIHPSRGCGTNTDGDQKSKIRTILRNSTRDCQITCEEDRECMEVDSKTHKPKSKALVVCVMYRHACSNPILHRTASYRLEIRKKIVNMNLM